MSNILKGYFVSVEDDARTVDVQELMEKRLQEAEEQRALLNMPSFDEAEEAYEEGEGDGFTEGISAASLDSLLTDEKESAVIKSRESEELENLKNEIAEAEENLVSLKAQAENILSDANNEASSIKNEAFESGRSEGYEDGYNEGLREVDKLKASIEEERRSLELQYEEELKNIEPLLVDKITDIYEHIFLTDLSGSKDILLHLLTEALNASGENKNIIIHLSRADFPEVAPLKNEILTEAGLMDDNVEIIQDATLKEGESMVETDNGIFDCSLGTELSELKRKLKILSYR